MPTTKYIWDVVNDTVLMETDGDGNTLATYTHEPDYHGELISMNRGGVESFFHYDGEGNTRALTDINGNITDEYTYNASGEVLSHTGNTTNPFGYKGALGYYANPETNDYYVRARTYEPTIARWLSPDPAGFVDGMNLYTYVLNDPVNKVDPSGEWCEGTNCCCCVNDFMFVPGVKNLKHGDDVSNCFGKPITPGRDSIGNLFYVRVDFETKPADSDKPCLVQWFERSNQQFDTPKGTVFAPACGPWQDSYQRAEDLGFPVRQYTKFKNAFDVVRCPRKSTQLSLEDCPFTPLRVKADLRILYIGVRVVSTCETCAIKSKEWYIRQLCRINEKGKPECTINHGKTMEQTFPAGEWEKYCPPKKPM